MIKISVRTLVEFICRSGDINNSGSGVQDTESMQLGSKIHRKIQKRMGPEYEAEVSLKIDIPIKEEDTAFVLRVEGRADGVIHKEPVIIDEIKSTYLELFMIEQPVSVHKAQAMCYAYIYAKENNCSEMGIRMTYCNIETEMTKVFEETMSFEELEKWFLGLIDEYKKWAVYQVKWKEERNASIKQMDFPFEYRKGQKELVKGVYQTILRNKNLFIEAPTGVGKTISTIFPTVKAMGEGLVDIIFYLTAKTITRTVAENCVSILIEHGAKIKPVTITAKEKLCILDKVECNPMKCERAKGHFDRVNDAVYHLVRENEKIDRDTVLDYAEKYCVCPFEMCLDTTLWVDFIICDYNYLFDPNVYLKRFFMGEKKNNYAFLIDEAHNLVERGREMYSSVLMKEDFLEVKRIVTKFDESTGQNNKPFLTRLESCNKEMLRLKRNCDDFTVIETTGNLTVMITRLMSEYEKFLKENLVVPDRETILEFYFSLRNFLYIYESMNEKYCMYTDYSESGQFRLKLQCMDPSDNLAECIERGKSAVFFSATLLPIRYYKDQLGGKQDDYAVYAPTSFLPENRLLMISNDVSTLYSRRTAEEYEKITKYIMDFVSGKQGNYLVFFPSYAFMEKISDLLNQELYNQTETELIMQKNSMTEVEKEEFLDYFQLEEGKTKIGFCVMGGIFGEGIDLKHDRLIGAVIVGTGLPMVCNERELFRSYYDKRNHNGFEYAYLYQGMNKVQQSAGRVIRTVEDKGVILLLDERFCYPQYKKLFPNEWYPNIIVNSDTMKQKIKEFWRDHDEESSHI